MNDGSLRKFYGLFTVLGLLVGGLVVLGYYKDEDREWKFTNARSSKRKVAAPQRRSSGRLLKV